jgi:tetratricopeptide (TPR) repeat protein
MGTAWQRIVRPEWLRSDRIALVAIALVALALRLAYLREIRSFPDFETPNPVLDAFLKDRIARNILAGDWLGGPEARYASSHLYAYFLAFWYALVGPSWLVSRVVQLTLGALATPFLLYLIGRRAFSGPVGLLAALMGAIYGPFIFGEGLVLSSGVAAIPACLVLLGLLVAQQRGLDRDWLLAGAAIGLLTLLRLNGAVLLAAAFGWALLVGLPGGPWPRIRRALFLLLGAILVFTPMVIRGIAADPGSVSVASLAGIHFFVGNHPGADGGYSRVPGVEASPRGHVEDATRLAEQALGRRLSPPQVSAYWLRQGFQFIRERPREYLRLLGRKLLLAVHAVEMPQNENSYYQYRREAAVLRLPLLTFTVVGPLGLLGFLLSLKRWREIGLLHLAFLAYLGSLLLFFVTGVYRVPLVPPLLVFSAFTVWWGYQRAIEESHLPLVAATAALAVLVLLTQTKMSRLESQTPTREELARRDESVRRWRDARLTQLEKHAVVAPEDYLVHQRLAGLYSNKGKWEEAVQEYERAATMTPPKEALLDIRIRLAMGLTELKRYQEAKRRWQEVQAMEPPPEIQELARRRLIRLERALRSQQPSAAREKGARE